MTDENIGLFSGTRAPNGTLTFTPAAQPVPTPGLTILNVPWLSQLLPAHDADWSNNDCGPACLAMWFRYRGMNVTVNDVSRATGLARGYSGTVPQDLITAAKVYGLDLRHNVGLTLPSLVLQIVAGRPSIVLVDYPNLPKRYDPNYRYGHWILVVGYGATEIVYHDPYYRDSTGEAIVISNDAFYKAWSTKSVGNSYVCQALRSGEAT